ncbi:hypothetical protein [Nocardia sp. NBC_01009]|uniref:hypothetical protein n=1 Tax=Nocardia sp. NBC_01009 TaxID=2975996 RepID=UPI00386C7568|nr:hypothetical protein OHA42_04840 [Nocardia sp. NBC_01009]
MTQTAAAAAAAGIVIPHTHFDGHGRYHTSYNGDEAVWVPDEDGVIRVDYWVSIDDDGDPCELRGAELGACFDNMPRRLWDEIRWAYERIRDQERRSAWSTK